MLFSSNNFIDWDLNLIFGFNDVSWFLLKLVKWSWGKVLMFFGICFENLFVVMLNCFNFVIFFIDEGIDLLKKFFGNRYWIILGKKILKFLGRVFCNLVSERCRYCNEDRLNRFLNLVVSEVVLRFKKFSFFSWLMFFGIELFKLFCLRFKIWSFFKFLIFFGIFLVRFFFIW